MPPPHSVKIKCLFVSLPTVRSTPDIELEWKTNTQIKYKSTCCFTDRDLWFSPQYFNREQIWRLAIYESRQSFWVWGSISRWEISLYTVETPATEPRLKALAKPFLGTVWEMRSAAWWWWLVSPILIRERCGIFSKRFSSHVEVIPHIVDLPAKCWKSPVCKPFTEIKVTFWINIPIMIAIPWG